MNKLGTQLIMFILKLNEIKEKKYSKDECSARDVYIFSSKSEYYEYYLRYGLNIKDKELLDLAILTRLQNGNVIALKGLCDRIITKSNDRYITLEEIDEIHARGNMTPFELAQTWWDFELCPFGDFMGSAADRCNKYKSSCWNCMFDYAKEKKEDNVKIKKYYSFKDN